MRFADEMGTLSEGENQVVIFADDDDVIPFGTMSIKCGYYRCSQK